MNVPLPEPGESFWSFLQRVDPGTAAYHDREHHSKEEMTAYRRGCFRGEWSLLWELLKDIERGETDAELLVRGRLAAAIALKGRRTNFDFAELLRAHREAEHT